MQMDSWMAFEPAVFFRLVGIQVVQHGIQIAIRAGGHDLRHEIQKLTPPPGVMARNDLSGSHLEGCQ